MILSLTAQWSISDQTDEYDAVSRALGGSKNRMVFYLLREALFPLRGARKSVVRSVRSSVRPFVRIIIVFCEEDLGVARMLLSTGSLNLRFFRTQKVNTPK